MPGMSLHWLMEDLNYIVDLVKSPLRWGGLGRRISEPDNFAPSRADIVQDKTIDTIIYPISYAIKIIREYRELSKILKH